MAARTAAARSAASRRKKGAPPPKKASSSSSAAAAAAAAAAKRGGVKKDGTRVAIMQRGESGFGMAIASDCTVSSFTFPGCPAEVSGLTVGSRILQVNKQPVTTKKALMNEIKFGGQEVEISYRLPDKVAAAKVRCQSGHALEREPRIKHLCNLCAVQGTHFGCPEGCDYDLCTGCY